MGVSICWRAIKPGKHLNVGARSAFMVALNAPRTLSSRDIEFLRGLGAGNGDFRPAMEELIDAIDRHGEIEVYGEY